MVKDSHLQTEPAFRAILEGVDATFAVIKPSMRPVPSSGRQSWWKAGAYAFAACSLICKVTLTFIICLTYETIECKRYSVGSWPPQSLPNEVTEFYSNPVIHLFLLTQDMRS